MNKNKMYLNKMESTWKHTLASPDISYVSPVEDSQ